MLAAWIIGMLHREAAAIVDSTVLMAGLGLAGAAVYHHDSPPQRLTIKASTKIGFKPAKALKDKVNG